MVRSPDSAASGGGRDSEMESLVGCVRERWYAKVGYADASGDGVGSIISYPKNAVGFGVTRLAILLDA